MPGICCMVAPPHLLLFALTALKPGDIVKTSIKIHPALQLTWFSAICAAGVGGKEVCGGEDSMLMTDLIEYCHEGGKSRVDLAGAMANFRDADAPSLERSGAMHLWDH